jgi:hypothetical protein
VGALSLTETVSSGILYYAFAVFLVPTQRDLGFSTAQLTGAFSLALLVSGIAGIAVGGYLDRGSPRGLMTVGSLAGALLVLAWSQVEGLRRRAMTAMRLVAALASFIFLPLAQALIDAHGWRDALVILALARAGLVQPGNERRADHSRARYRARLRRRSDAGSLQGRRRRDR